MPLQDNVYHLEEGIRRQQGPSRAGRMDPSRNQKPGPPWPPPTEGFGSGLGDLGSPQRGQMGSPWQEGLQSAKLANASGRKLWRNRRKKVRLALGPLLPRHHGQGTGSQPVRGLGTTRSPHTALLQLLAQALPLSLSRCLPQGPLEVP